MSNTQAAFAVNLVVGEDLNGDYGEVLALNTVGQVIKASTATSAIIGVLAEDPKRTTTAGVDSVPVALIGKGGVLRMKAGAAITAGQVIVPDATSGRVAGVANIGALAADQMGVGFALEAAADGQLLEVLAMTVAGPHST